MEWLGCTGEGYDGAGGEVHRDWEYGGDGGGIGEHLYIKRLSSKHCSDKEIKNQPMTSLIALLSVTP